MGSVTFTLLGDTARVMHSDARGWALMYLAYPDRFGKKMTYACYQLIDTGGLGIEVLMGRIRNKTTVPCHITESSVGTFLHVLLPKDAVFDVYTFPAWLRGYLGIKGLHLMLTCVFGEVWAANIEHLHRMEKHPDYEYSTNTYGITITPNREGWENNPEKLFPETEDGKWHWRRRIKNLKPAMETYYTVSVDESKPTQEEVTASQKFHEAILENEMALLKRRRVWFEENVMKPMLESLPPPLNTVGFTVEWEKEVPKFDATKFDAGKGTGLQEMCGVVYFDGSSAHGISQCVLPKGHLGFHSDKLEFRTVEPKP